VESRADRFPLMDSLRAIAALLVLVGHAGLLAGALGPGSDVKEFAARLDVGVAVFFLISGFLLYRPFVRARLTGRPGPSTGAYAWRRVLRIVPAYWVALTVVAIVFSLDYVFTADGVLTFYGFGQIYRSSTAVGGIGQAWTLCIEITFYAMLPLWAFAMRRLLPAGHRAELGAVAALFVFSVVWKLVVIGGEEPVVTGPPLVALPAFLDHFAIGMALAILSAAWQDRPEREQNGFVRFVDRHSWAPWAFAVAAYLTVAYAIGLPGTFPEETAPVQYVVKHELYALVGLGLLLPAVFGDTRRGVVRRFLGTRVLLWLGLVSYGIYLWHQAVLAQAYEWGLPETSVTHPYLVWPAVGIVGAVALATISYYVVERPILSLKRLVPGRVPPGEAIAEHAPAVPPRPAEQPVGVAD
jgi:peptidoglycan/LPS O-acetylase OafA/YrhL